LRSSRIFVFKLSNELRALSKAEFRAVVEAEAPDSSYECLGELVFAEMSEDEAVNVASRMALIKSWGRLIDVCELNDVQDLVAFVKKLEEEGYCISIDCVRGYGKDLVHKALGRGMKVKSCREAKNEPMAEVVLIDGIAVAYQVKRLKRSERFGHREPHRRPIYLPGTMKAWLARVFVNLARVRRGDTLLDPFCGVGGFALEACAMGIKCICCDIDLRMVCGARANVRHYGCEDLVEVLQCDAAMEPALRVDAIATDPPYGRMSVPRGRSLAELMTMFIRRCLDAVRNGGHVVFAVPEYIDPTIVRLLNELGLTIVERLLNWVHGGLVRVLYVVKV